MKTHLLKQIGKICMTCTLLVCSVYSVFAQSADLSLLKPGFVKNQGQVADTDGQLLPEVLYTLQSKGVTLYLTKTGIRYVFSKVVEVPGFTPDHDEHLHFLKPVEQESYRTDMQFVASNPLVQVVSELPYPYYTNYYYAHCPQGVTNVLSYGRLIYKSLYPGIDLLLEATEEGLSMQYILRHAALLENIKFTYLSASSSLDAPEKLKTVTDLGEITQLAGQAQTSSMDDEDGSVQVTFSLINGFVNIQAGDIVLGPVNVKVNAQWSAYYGGTGNDISNNLCLDRFENILFTGVTNSANLPQTLGAFQGETIHNSIYYGDAFVAKCSPTGDALLWATYYGGSDADIGSDVTTDIANNIYISGGTWSTNFPVTNATTYSGTANATLGGDACAFSLTDAGIQRWSTFLGGTDADLAHVADIGRNGNMVIGGHTYSNVAGTNFPVTQGTFTGFYQGTAGSTSTTTDGFIAVFDAANGNQLYTSYYGGANSDDIYGIDIETDNTIYLTGQMRSTGFTMTANALQASHGAGTTNDGHVLVMNGALQRIYASYLGGGGSDICRGIGANPNNDRFAVTGETSSATGFPLNVSGPNIQNAHGGGTSDAFTSVFNLSTSGATTTVTNIWTDLFGGSGTDAGMGVDFITNGPVVITGNTNSANLRRNVSSSTASQPNALGGTDAFVVTFDEETGQQLCGTYYGGSQNDESYQVQQRLNTGYITGFTRSNDLPATAGTFGANHTAGQDAYVAALDLTCTCPPFDACFSLVCPNFCSETAITFVPNNTNGSHSWNFGDGSTSAAVSPTHTYFNAGTYIVTHTVTYLGCTYTCLDTVIITQSPPSGFECSNCNLCPGETVTFTAVPPYPGIHTWNFGDGNFESGTDLFVVSHTYASRGSYTVTHQVSDPLTGCVHDDSKTIKVLNLQECCILAYENANDLTTYDNLTLNSQGDVPAANSFNVRNELTISHTANISLSGKTIYFYPQAKLLVDGGTLTLSGTTLTAIECASMWQGVELNNFLEDDAPMVIQDPGELYMLNSSVIEHAITGVKFGGPNNYLNYMEAENSTFRNNYIGLQMRLQGAVPINLSKVTDCRFVTDAPMRDAVLFPNGSHYAHADLFNLQSVSFDHCTFETDGEFISPSGDRGIGINSLNARFLLNYQPGSIFRNLRYGILHGSSVNFSTDHEVTYNEFYNNDWGMALLAGAEVKTRLNLFDGCTVGIDGSGLISSYFAGNTFDGGQAGMSMSMTGPTQMDVFDNDFTNCSSYGILSSLGNNTGLWIKCNDFDGTTQTNIYNRALLGTQGNSQCANTTHPAGNRFNTANSTGGDVYVTGNASHFFYYHHPFSDAVFKPIVAGVNAALMQATMVKVCGSNPFQNEQSCIDDADLREPLFILGDIQRLLAELQDMDSEDIQALVDELISSLTEQNRSASIIPILQSIPHDEARWRLIPEYLVRSRFDEAAQTLNTVQKNTEEQQIAAQYYGLLIGWGKAGKSYFELSAADRSELERIARTETPVAYNAQAILGYVYGLRFEAVPEPIPGYPARLRRDQESVRPVTANSRLQAVPNPSSGETEIRYRLSKDEQASIRAYNVTGKLVQEYQGEAGRTIIPAGALKPGLYIYKLVLNGVEIAADKLVITE